MIEDRRSDARGAKAHRQKARIERAGADEQREWQAPSARRPRQRAKQKGEQARQPQNRLAISRQVEGDPGHRSDGDPEEQPALFDLSGEGGREERAPVRRPRCCARNASRRARQNAGLSPKFHAPRPFGAAVAYDTGARGTG